MRGSSAYASFLLFLVPRGADLGACLNGDVFAFGYTDVNDLCTYLLHGLVYEVLCGPGVLLGDRGEDLVVDHPHDLKPGNLEAPLVHRDGDGLHHVGGATLDWGVQGLAVAR